MAALFDSDSEEEFIGFTIEPGFERNYPESEPDISVSSVDMEDLSDLDLSDQESGEEDEQEWNDDPGLVDVNPFVANTGLVRDVRGYSTINFFNLMFKESNFDKIAEETNRYARQAMETKPDPAWRETDSEEVKAFFALNILFGIKQLPKVYSYWSRNQLLGVPEVQKIFQRNGTVIQVPSAPVVKTYNNNMGGVDLSDQMRGYYMAGRKSKKWWRCLMWFFVDVSIVNAYILEKLSPHHRSRTQLAFHLDLVKLLIGNFSARRFSASSGRLEGGHWPIKFSKGRCKRCLKRNKETWCRMACELCGKRICLDCFKNHTTDDLA